MMMIMLKELAATMRYISDVSEDASEVLEVCSVMIEQSNLHQ
jgi:hypothetical protein